MLAATPPDATTSETVAPTPALLLTQATLALEVLGAGFLANSSNTELRSRTASGLLKPDDYQRQLLWILYQLLTSLLLESRGLTAPLPTQWLDVVSFFRNLATGSAQKLGAIAGLFDARHCPDLGSAALDESVLLRVFSLLTNSQSQARHKRVNNLLLTSRQLAGLYEALLELKPAFASSGAFQYTRDQETQASSRRSRGSYYTPDHLIQIVLDQALEPLITEAVATRAPAQALLELSIVDPACGAGHFLLAAAKRLALHLARIEGNSGSENSNDALARVSSQCIFGVDLDDLAVELCKLNLWLETASVSDSISSSRLNIHCGHALLGAPAEVISAAGGPLAADTWCAQFFNSEGEASGEARRSKKASIPSAEQAQELAEQYHFFHWQLSFPEVFAKGGFDLILGNPPWIAHAGRAAQGLPISVKRFYKSNYEAFADYPTTHGLFASVLPRYLRNGGRLGLVVPSSLAELGGYQPARRAHDRLCNIPIELTDFGEGQFEGVTQPCMALVSQRTAEGRSDAPFGEAWPVARPDLNATDRALLDRLKQLAPLPSKLFGERGLQSDPSLSAHFRKAATAEERFTTPLREGTDVREFEVLTPRYHVDAAGLGSRLRSAAEYREVRLVVRQTARYPIAALSDGIAFRNSLLAGFASSEWPAETLVALLNSTLIRWLHFQRFRDARQPVLPQVKVAHLRAIPAPAQATQAELDELSRLGLELSRGISPDSNAAHRDALEALVSAIYGLSFEEREAVARWHARFHVSPKKATR